MRTSTSTKFLAAIGAFYVGWFVLYLFGVVSGPWGMQ